MRRVEGLREVFLNCTRDWEIERGKEEVVSGLAWLQDDVLVWVTLLEPGFPALTCLCADSELCPFLVHRSALPKLCLKMCQYYTWLSASSAASLLLLALAVLSSWPFLAFFVFHDSALTNAMIPGIWPQPDPLTDSAVPFGFPGRGTCRLSGEPDDTLGPDCDSWVCSGPSAAWGALLWLLS